MYGVAGNLIGVGKRDDSNVKVVGNKGEKI